MLQGLGKLKANFFIVHSTEYNAAWQDAGGPAQGEKHLKSTGRLKPFCTGDFHTLEKKQKQNKKPKPSGRCMSPMGMQQ